MRQTPTICFGLVILSFALTGRAEEPSKAMSPELVTRLGELLERDWEGRPPWADMAIDILKGGPMGSGNGWFTGAERRHDWDWLAQSFAEAAADKRIGRDEISLLSKADFDRIDSNGDGEITPADFRFLKHPQLEDESPLGGIFSRLDVDSNGRLTMIELQAWFDRSADGADFLSVEDLTDALTHEPKRPRNKRTSTPRVDQRWKMLELLISGEMGSLTEGPDLNQEAPELDLPMVAQKEDGGLELTDRFVKLSDSRGQKPVVLIFGSFT